MLSVSGIFLFWVVFRQICFVVLFIICQSGLKRLYLREVTN